LEPQTGDPRQNPYYFLKAPVSITGNGDPIILPKGRTQIDWECELNIVIGKTAKYVKAENAAEYIFGYTLDNDVSDRGGRADGRHGLTGFLARVTTRSSRWGRMWCRDSSCRILRSWPSSSR
jgi:2-keto-4-pentenoate hydratase/2-oxohepta-3-ene-1,7-dioic acid hydratase in catechol pathway